MPSVRCSPDTVRLTPPGFPPSARDHLELEPPVQHGAGIASPQRSLRRRISPSGCSPWWDPLTGCDVPTRHPEGRPGHSYARTTLSTLPPARQLAHLSEFDLQNILQTAVFGAHPKRACGLLSGADAIELARARRGLDGGLPLVPHPPQRKRGGSPNDEAPGARQREHLARAERGYQGAGQEERGRERPRRERVEHGVGATAQPIRNAELEET